MLRDVSHVDVPRFGGGYGNLSVRTPFLRILRSESTGVVSDFGLLQRAAPQTEFYPRAGLTVVFEGDARFEEDGRRVFYGRGEWVRSEMRRAGTEAFGGARARQLVLEWDPSVLGAPVCGTFRCERVAEADVRRLDELSRGLAGPRPTEAAAAVLTLLRAMGLPLVPTRPGDLETRAPSHVQSLMRALAGRLMSVDEFPGIDDLAQELGWNHRQVHRRLAELRTTYQMSFRHWRDAIHQARICHALRLCSMAGATTESIARLAGFRAPTALCHAFADVGLPSPGTLVATAGRSDPLARWAEFVDGPRTDAGLERVPGVPGRVDTTADDRVVPRAS